MAQVTVTVNGKVEGDVVVMVGGKTVLGVGGDDDGFVHVEKPDTPPPPAPDPHGDVEALGGGAGKVG